MYLNGLLQQIVEPHSQVLMWCTRVSENLHLSEFPGTTAAGLGTIL